MATERDFIVNRGLIVSTTAQVNGVDLLANDGVTLLSARANDYNTYNTLVAMIENVSANTSSFQANDYNTYTTLQAEYRANDGVTLGLARANDYTTYVTLQSEYRANDGVTLGLALANDGATLASARANDYTTYTTLRSEYQANDVATLNSARANDGATLLSARANDYSTYTTLQSEYRANDGVTLGLARANDYNTYTTLRSEYQANDGVTLGLALSNDGATLATARANDYNTYTTLQSEYRANDGATLATALANDATTYTTLRSEYQANDVATLNLARANDGATLLSARANDYSTYITLQSEYRANDVATLNAARANDGVTLLSARANDYSTYITLQSEYRANDGVTLGLARANDGATLLSARANDYTTYTTLVNEYNANDYSTYITLRNEYRANDYATWTGLNSFVSIKANSDVALIAGDGLTGGGTLASNISVAVDSTVVRTTGAQNIGGTKTFTDSVVVEGDFTVNGNVVTIGSTNITVDDRFIQLAANAVGAPVADVGIYLNRGNQGNSAFYYDQAGGYFAIADTLDPATNSVVSPTSYAALRVGTILVSNTALVTNLNADRLDSQEGSYYVDFNNATNTNLITLDRVLANGNVSTRSISVGGLTVDSNTFVVNAASDSVGIRVATPLAPLQVEAVAFDTSSLATTTTTANQVLDTFAAASFRTAKYIIQVHDTANNRYHTSEIALIHDGTTAYITEYAIVYSSVSLATFNADVSGGNVRLLVTPLVATNTIRTYRTSIIA